MKFSAIVKSCRSFEYTDKSGKTQSAFSVNVVLSDYEEFAVFSKDEFCEGEKCYLLIKPGIFNKPIFSVSRPFFDTPTDPPFAA